MAKEVVNQDEQKIYPLLNGRALHTLEGIQQPNGMSGLYIRFLNHIETMFLYRGETLDMNLHRFSNISACVTSSGRISRLYPTSARIKKIRRMNTGRK